MKKPIIRQLLVALIATVLAYLLGFITNRIARIFGLGSILGNTLGILLKCIPAMFLSYIIVEKLICKEKLRGGKLVAAAFVGVLIAAVLGGVLGSIILRAIMISGYAYALYNAVSLILSLLFPALGAFLGGFIYYAGMNKPQPAPYYGYPTGGYGAPTYGAPSYTAPSYTAPAYTAPVAPAPQAAPVYSAPVAPAPQAAPVYSAPVAPAPEAAPVYSAPVAPAPEAAPAPVVPAAPVAPAAAAPNAYLGANAAANSAAYGAPYGGAGYGYAPMPEDVDGLSIALLNAVRFQLKAPMSAVMCRNEELRIRDKGGVYEVEGIVHSQNSYGAMIATDFSATAVRSAEGWKVLNATVGMKTAKNYAKNFVVNYIAISIFVGVMGLLGYLILSAIIGF